MATSTMFADFTSANRRKKTVTYGKNSRPPTSSKPPSTLREDAAVPERSREHVAASTTAAGVPPKGHSEVGHTSLHARETPANSDIFDVPSEDEFLTHATKPAKSLPRKRRIPEDEFDVPLSDEEAQVQTPAKKAAQPLRKPAPARPTASTAKTLQRTSKHAQAAPTSSSDPIAPQPRRAKTLQPAPATKRDTGYGSRMQRSLAPAKATSRSTTPALSAPKVLKPTKASKAASKKALPKPPVKAPADLGVFDVPMSDEEPEIPLRKPLRQGLVARKGGPATAAETAAEDLARDPAGSDDSTASRKRKRQGSFSSVSTIKPTIEQRRESSVPQRSRKQQKKAEENVHAAAKPTVEAQPVLPAINKPKRTRQRTVPVLTRPAILKGESSPANLDRLLSSGTASRPSPVAEVPELNAPDDETMYDIQHAQATPVRSTKAPGLASVTPRQKALFSGILGSSSSAATPMPSMSALRLTDAKPRSLLGALSRSKSDITESPQARRTKLISALKQADSSSEDDEGGSASDTEDELLQSKRGTLTIGESSANLQQVHSPEYALPDEMIDEIGVATESQTSQTLSGFGARPRLTYAKSRSYLQEANPEDAFLVSMDLDDGLGLDSQKKNGFSDDEDDPSQAQAYHELKRQGQQNLFNDDAQMLMDDISSDKSASIRRSAMLELCTKMQDMAFTSQLLDSPWAHDMTGNMSSNGEPIFDFAMAVTIIYVVRTDPTNSILPELFRRGITTTLVKLMKSDVDIRRIAKDRKTNLSRLAQESVLAFRAQVERSIDWYPGALDKVSSQLVAAKALEMLLASLQQSGTTQLLLTQDAITNLVDLATSLCNRLGSGTNSIHNTIVLDLVLSILQVVSVTPQMQVVWSAVTLQRLADMMPSVLLHDHASSVLMAMKVCMNLTNNKPKACQSFSETGFIQSLVSSIIHKFGVLRSIMLEQQRIDTVETLILSLGAMINLAEFSDQARLNVDDGQQMISSLVTSFVDGSERAAQADSLEETHSGVAVGYLGVLLGNLCLNESVRAKIRAELPQERLDMVIDKIKEFIQVHKHADLGASQVEGVESQETWHNYTARLMRVVKNLEKVER